MNIFDAHISGSLSVSGSGEISNDLLISGNLTVLGTISGSISGSITDATNAETASYAPKYTLTSSFNTFTSSYNTGSFSGSFKGDGSNLYNIPASGVTGLNLNKIISGSVSASISPNRGFEVNTDATFTGSVNITGSIYLNGNPIGTGKLDETTFNSYTSSINTYTGNTASTIATLSTTSSVNTLSSSIATTDLNQNNRLNSLEGVSGSYATTGSNLFKGNQTISGSIIPATNASYDLGDATHPFRHLYLSSASLYIDGTKVLGSTTQELQITTDNGQSIKILEAGSDNITLQSADGDIELKSSGGGDILFDPTNGLISIKGTAQIQDGYKITSSGGTNIVFGDGIIVSGSIELTGTVDGIDLQSFSSSVNGKLTSVETSTSSLNTFTSSASGRLTSLESASSSIRTDFNTFTSSALTRVTAIETSTSSLNTFTSSANGRLSSLETTSGSINTFTASALTRVNTIESTTSSLNTFTSSLSGAVEVTGSNLTVKGNLLVKGTTTQIDSTTLNIGDNIIQLNGSGTSNAGLAVQDATGVSTVSGSLLWDTATDYWKAGKLGSEDRIILSTEFTNLSSSILSRATSLESASSSIRNDFNSFTSSNNSIESTQNSRLTSIEGVTGSIGLLNTYTGSNNTVIGTLQTATSSINTFTASALTRVTAIETSTGSLNTFTSSANGRLTSIESKTGSITSLNTYTGSNDTTNTTQNSRLTALETTTESLNTFTSSAAGRLTSLESASSSIRSDFNSFTSSNNAIETTQNGRLTSLESTTGSLNTYTGSNNTIIGTLQTATSSLNSYTSSQNTHNSAVNTFTSSASGRLTSIETSTSSLNTFTSSAGGRLTSIEGKTGSYATTGSNTFVGSQTVSGSLIITQNLTVFGSSSITYVTSSQLRIDDNIITVNTSSPGSRFGGLEVYDSGSVIQATGSILWDSVNNRWIYQQSSEATYGGGVLMSGPRSSGSLGSELTLTSGRVAKSAGGDHLNDSNITDNGTTVSINSNTEITGSLIVTNTIVSQTTPLVSGSSQISYTGITNVPSGIVSGSSQVLNSSGVWSGSAQLPSGIISGSSQLPSGTVSGSIQIDITNTTNYTSFSSSIATTDSNQNTRLGLLETSTGSLNTFTSSASGRLTSLESASSSIRSDFNTFTSSALTRVSAIETSTGSLNTFTSSANGRLTSLESASSSIRSDFNSFTSSNNIIIGTLQTATSSLNTYTSSNNTLVGTLQTATSSLNSYTSSNTTNINAIHTATSSLNTFTSSFNTAIGLSGADVTVKGNLTISGTTTTINSTTVAIGDNIIQLNGTGATNAGLVVRDATAPNTVSGSLLWDTTNDKWIAGPLGSEDDIVLRTASQTLTNKTINASQLVDASVSNAKLASSAITIAGTSTSLGGSISAATILSGTGVWSGSLQLPSGTVSGSAQIIAGLPSGTVSGSIQVALTGTSGFGTYLNQAVLTTSSPTFSTVNATTFTDGYITYSVAQINRSAGYVELQYASGGGVKMFGGGATPITFATNGTITSGTWNGTTIAISNGGTGGTTASAARTNLGLAIGTDVLAYRTFGTAANSNIGDFAAYNATTYVGTTAIALNRSSSSQTLTGVSIDGSSASTTGNAATATNLSNSGTVTLATATESNSIYITQPSYTSYTPVKLLNFAWYSDIWSLGNIRSTGAGSSGFGIFLSSVEKFRFTDGAMTIGANTVLHAGNYSTYASPVAGSSSITTVGTIASGTWNGTAIAVANGGTGATTAATARTNLGLAIGTDVLAYRTFGTAAASATGDFAAYNATHYVGTTAIAANRASASQTLTGVSIDGSAASATTATQIGGRAFSNTGDNSGVAADSLATNGISYASSNVALLGQTDGALYSQAYSTAWQHQIYGDYRTGQIVVRGKNSGTWQAWRTIIDSTTIGSQTVTYATGETLTTVTGRNSITTNSIGVYQVSASCPDGVNQYVLQTSGTSRAYIRASTGTLFLNSVTGNDIQLQTDGTTRVTVANGGATTFTSNVTVGGVLTENSSIRYKKDVETIKYGLDKVLQMRGVTYVKKDTGLTEVGVIAEEMNEVEPLLTIKNEEGEVDSVTYGRINAYLIEAVKELKQELNEQNLIITELKRKLGL